MDGVQGPEAGAQQWVSDLPNPYRVQGRRGSGGWVDIPGEAYPTRDLALLHMGKYERLVDDSVYRVVKVISEGRRS